jgi:hypothetical protein
MLSDRDGDRQEGRIKELIIENRNECIIVVKFTAKQCRNIDAEPKPAPLPENKFHAEVFRTGNPIAKLTDSQAKKMLSFSIEVQ